MSLILLCLLLCVVTVNTEYYDTYTGVQISEKRFDELRNFSLVPWCAIEVAPCDPHEPRRTDNSCNNLRYPTRGAHLTPFHRVLPAHFSEDGQVRRALSGEPLPPPRALRVALMSDGRASSDVHTQMVVNYAVFVTGDITSVHDTVNYVAVTRDCCLPDRETDSRCAPITVPDDDVHMRRSSVRCLNLTTPITYQRLGCVAVDVPPERINTAAPMLELSGVYGHEAVGAARGRVGQGGRLRSEMIQGKEWPPTGSLLCVNNEPPLETRCHDIPSAGSNSILGLNLIFLWFYRSHNSIVRHLEALNPCWDDNKLYYTAREINIAYSNQILYYEYMPLIIGRDSLLKNHVIFETSGHVDDYSPTLEPRVSLEYVTSTRWFHTLQEGRLKMYTRDGILYDEQAVVDFTLRTGALQVNDTLAGVTQGAFRQAGAAADGLVDPDIGSRILGRLQFASDVIASDISKGRLLGLPSYARYRRYCGLPELRSFKDLYQWMDTEQVEVFSRYYASPADIDLMAALLAEKPSHALAPPTLACLMIDQLLRWRRADRFWYEHPDHPQAFTAEQLREIRKMTTSKLLCQYGDDVQKIQPNAFLLPGPGNKMTPCSKYEMPNLQVYADPACSKSNLRYSDANPFRSYNLKIFS